MTDITLISSNISDDAVSSIIIPQSIYDGFIKELVETGKGYAIPSNMAGPNGFDHNIHIHLLRAIYTNNIVRMMGGNNVLVIPSFTDDYPTTYVETVGDDDNTHYTTNIAQHLFPIVNTKFSTDANVYVAYPSDHTSLYKYLMEEYDVDIIESNKMYTLGDDTWQITTDMNGVRFDTVVLIGVPYNGDDEIRLVDVKSNFENYCTSEFILWDDFEDNDLKKDLTATYGPNAPISEHMNRKPNRIDRSTGTRKNIDKIADYMATHAFPSQYVTDETQKTISQLSEAIKEINEIYQC